MRVNNIMNQDVKTCKSRRLKIQLTVLTAFMTILGTNSLIAVASPAVSLDKDAQPSVRFPPIFPASCKANEGKYAASVSVTFDVDKRGNVKNIRIIKTDNACFNQATIDSVAKWKYAPILQKGKPRKRKGVQAMIKYRLPD